LEDVRVVLLPQPTTTNVTIRNTGIMYLFQATDSEPWLPLGSTQWYGVVTYPDCELYGKAILTVRRSDGSTVEIDPALIIVRYKGDRLYFHINYRIMETAVLSAKTGAKPKYRPVPLGLDQVTIDRLLTETDWAEANRMLDTLKGK
jgi:hypothetical protein